MSLSDTLPPPAPSAAIEADAAALRLLAPLRFPGRTCRAKARLDAFEACRMLSLAPSASVQAHADALFRVLSLALGRPLKLHAPGSTDLSFDERWLASLVAAAGRGDAGSLGFLAAHRIPRHMARQTVWLARQLAESLAETERNARIWYLSKLVLSPCRRGSIWRRASQPRASQPDLPQKSKGSRA